MKNIKNVIDRTRKVGRTILKSATLKIMVAGTIGAAISLPFVDAHMRYQYREEFRYEGKRVIISPKEKNGFTLFYDLNNPLSYKSLIDENRDGEADHYNSGAAVGIAPWALVPIFTDREPDEKEREFFRNVTAKDRDARVMKRMYK